MPVDFFREPAIVGRRFYGRSGTIISGSMQYSKRGAIEAMDLQSLEVDLNQLILVGCSFILWLLAMKSLCKYISELP